MLINKDNNLKFIFKIKYRFKIKKYKFFYIILFTGYNLFYNSALLNKFANWKYVSFCFLANSRAESI